MSAPKKIISTAKACLKQSSPVWYARLSRVMQAMRRRRHQDRIVEHLYGGRSLKIWLADATAQDWYDCDWGELPEIEQLKQSRLGAGARVFDLGAHHGVVALMLARIVGPDGQVVAVEADPFNFRVFQRNHALNPAPQLKLVHAAIHERSGELPASTTDAKTPSDRFVDWGDCAVRGMTLDDLTMKFGKPDVVFVDVDGFDCQVLRGARETLACRPDCFVEVHVGAGLEREGGSVKEVLSYFPSHQWSLHVASDEAREFIPFTSGHSLLSRRFFLIATSK